MCCACLCLYLITGKLWFSIHCNLALAGYKIDKTLDPMAMKTAKAKQCGALRAWSGIKDTKVIYCTQTCLQPSWPHLATVPRWAWVRDWCWESVALPHFNLGYVQIVTSIFTQFQVWQHWPSGKVVDLATMAAVVINLCIGYSGQRITCQWSKQLWISVATWVTEQSYLGMNCSPP